MNANTFKKSVVKGILAFLILLFVYFTVLTLISGWQFTLEQFSQFWFYIISLALGFGIQLSLYSYLRDITRQQLSSGQLVTTGATSTTAMISCCAHYLTNILPILGVTGIITFVTQYQIQFFWVGLVFNLLGILYIGSKVIKITGVKINKTAVLYSSILVIALLFFILNSVSLNINVKSAVSATAGSVPAGNNLATKEDDQGAISVAVTPENLDNNPTTWNFDIAINNHQVSIDNDLVADSLLLDDQGKSYKPVVWDGSAPGGHHRSGTLKFNPISPKPKSVELQIHNIGNIPVRSFKWDL